MIILKIIPQLYEPLYFRTKEYPVTFALTHRPYKNILLKNVMPSVCIDAPFSHIEHLKIPLIMLQDNLIAWHYTSKKRTSIVLL